MTGLPMAWPSTQSAPSANRAPQMVIVREHDGELASRVSIEFVERLLTSGAPIDREIRQSVLYSLRYQLQPNLNAQDQRDAAEDVAEAIGKLPQGTPREELEKARDRVVAGYAEECRLS